LSFLTINGWHLPLAYYNDVCISAKPKQCPPVTQPCSSPGGDVPLEYIPCGGSAGKGGQSDKENDWDCPGEQKCCIDPSGCHSICRPSPNCKYLFPGFFNVNNQYLVNILRCFFKTEDFQKLKRFFFAQKCHVCNPL